MVRDDPASCLLRWGQGAYSSESLHFLAQAVQLREGRGGSLWWPLRRGPSGSPASCTPSCRHGTQLPVAGPPETVPLPSLVTPAPRWVLFFGSPTRWAQKGDKSMGRGSVPSGRESPGHLDRCPHLSHYYNADALLSKGAPLPAQLPAHLQQPRTRSQIQTQIDM